MPQRFPLVRRLARRRLLMRRLMRRHQARRRQAVEEEIRKVEEDIQAATGELAKATDKDDKDYWRKEKDWLRKKEDQLRKEKDQLREEKLVALRAGAAAGPGPESAAIVGLPCFYQRFLDLLSLGNITRPNPVVLAAITRHCPARLLVLLDWGAAVDLYREAELFPGPSTEGHLLTQHGLRVNGPLFPNPAEGSASLLVGATSEGCPVVVKLLAGGVSADGAQQPGGAEAEVCRALIESKPAAVPLVPARIITFKLGDEHKSTAGRAPGLYAALCMPRYVSSLALMVPLPAAAVLAGGRRMAAALEWIHDNKYTHMDVKADNIFVDFEGRWWLGDFGSTVRTGSPVTSTTTYFAPCKLLDLPAKPEYDWHMLAVALVWKMNRNNWKALLVEGGCTPAKKLIAAVKELHGREGCKELACFLDELLQRAGYLAALP